jgi:hypothetical protein
VDGRASEFLAATDGTHQARKGELADEEVGGLLVLADLAQGDRARPEAVRFACFWSAFW